MKSSSMFEEVKTNTNCLLYIHFLILEYFFALFVKNFVYCYKIYTTITFLNENFHNYKLYLENSFILEFQRLQCSE